MTTDYVIIMHQRTNSRPARQALPKLECNVAESQRLIKRSSLKPPSLVYVCRKFGLSFLHPVTRRCARRRVRLLSPRTSNTGALLEMPLDECSQSRNLPEYQIYVLAGIPDILNF